MAHMTSQPKKRDRQRTHEGWLVEGSQDAALKHVHSTLFKGLGFRV